MLSLDEAFAAARSDSPQQKLIAERIVEAEVNTSRAWSMILPQWSANYTFTHVAPPPPSVEIPPLPDFRSDEVRVACSRDAFDFQRCATAVLESIQTAAEGESTVFDFARADTSVATTRITWNLLNGRAIPLISNAYDNLEMERIRADTKLRELLLTVARTFHAAIATRHAIEVAARALDRARRQHATIATLVDAGDRPRSLAESSALTVHQAEIDLARAENAFDRALEAVRIASGTRDFDDVAPPSPPVPPTGTDDDLVRRALSDRTDIRLAELAVAIAGRQEDDAWWHFAPVGGVFGGYRRSNVAGIDGRLDQWSIGFSASLQIYDGGLRTDDLATARSRIRSAHASLGSVRASIESEVRRAILESRAAELEILRARDTATLAGHNLDLVEAQLEAGTVRQVDLKDALDRRVDAELAILRAEMDRAMHILELQFAIGAFRPRG